MVEGIAPFDFDLTAQIFQNGDLQIRTYREDVFTQVIKLDNQLSLIQVTNAGTVEKPKLAATLTANNPLTTQDKTKAKQAITYLFNLGFNLNEFYCEVKHDTTMSQIAKKLYGLKNPTTLTVFESLVDSIVEQQISIKVALALEQKIARQFGSRLELHGQTFFAFPTPQTLAGISVEEIQLVGLSHRKAEYIHEAAVLIASGKLDLEGLRLHQNAEEIIRVLDEVRGIGVWTAELTMLRGMQKLDALPADDFGIRRVISRYYCGGRPIKADEARQIAKAWGHWKGLAAFYLIVAEAKEIKLL